ncbi:hypothetical protein [Aestuariivita sp.]|jgi:positive regulator of sigma E activity|uniref:hypothetical protein n=1 Tax=Aestuariivita sp. TaxID=1872407 RepID=UPI002171CEA8|nr:hypothetical protein [Aestuariivita sp.]MCE8008915.1 hypothetical protein [Aestuariivita sp.]
MNVLIYILPLACIAGGGALGFKLARAGRYAPIGVLFLAAAFGFWLCLHLAQDMQGWDGIGYAIVALLIIVPIAGGAFIGLVMGWLRRRRALNIHG